MSKVVDQGIVIITLKLEITDIYDIESFHLEEFTQHNDSSIVEEFIEVKEVCIPRDHTKMESFMIFIFLSRFSMPIMQSSTNAFPRKKHSFLVFGI